MKTTIKQYQEQIAKILNSDPYFAEHSAHWLVEDSWDVAFETKKRLAETGICCIVSTPKLEYQGVNHEGDMQFDTLTRLTVVENPTVNRGKPSNETALELVHHALYTLCGYYTGNFNNFTPSTVEQSTVGGTNNRLLQVAAEVQSTVTL